MKDLLLQRVRLSAYFWTFGIIFLVAGTFMPDYTFDSGTLTLFSVNSFLYGFYISPILGSQKTRIEELHKIVRSEANALFSMVLKLKKLPKETRNRLQAMVRDYVRAKLRGADSSGESEYEALITYAVEYKGENQDAVTEFLNDLVANQQNRTSFAMQRQNVVFANEWQIMAILFSVTLGFILTIRTEESWIFTVVQALLCTGLTMLIVILVKLNTLTHKKAKQIWQPLKKLIDTDFYRID